MNIIEEKEKTIYKNEINGKVSYAIGLSKKKEDGTYELGYLPCRFKKDVKLENKTKIKIKQAWLDFFKIEKKTYIYIFINDFEQVNKQVSEQVEQKQQDVWDSAKDIDIPEDELNDILNEDTDDSEESDDNKDAGDDEEAPSEGADALEPEDTELDDLDGIDDILNEEDDNLSESEDDLDDLSDEELDKLLKENGMI